MPSSSAPDNEIWAVVAYLKGISTVPPVEFVTGDADHGQEIFRSMCVRCHRVNGRGGHLGPDLSRVTRTRSRARLTQAIREPSASDRLEHPHIARPDVPECRQVRAADALGVGAMTLGAAGAIQSAPGASCGRVTFERVHNAVLSMPLQAGQ